MNSGNSETSDPHRLLIKRTDKIDLRRKYIALSNLSITWKKFKKSYKNNTFEIKSPTWNKESELPDGLHSISDLNKKIHK